MNRSSGRHGEAMTTITYTVHASRDQAERWEMAAAAHGRMAIGPWLASTADAFLREMAKAGRPSPLAWYRERFPVITADTSVYPPADFEITVPGRVSGPFGIFRGDARGPCCEGGYRYSLIHLPSHRIIATLPYQRNCKALAAELTVLQIDWHEKDAEKVVEGAPDQEKVKAVLRLFKTLTTR